MNSRPPTQECTMKPKQPPKSRRRVYPEEFKKEAVQMLLEGHSAVSVAENLGLPHASLLYRWKAQALDQAGTAASAPKRRLGCGPRCSKSSGSTSGATVRGGSPPNCGRGVRPAAPGGSAGC